METQLLTEAQATDMYDEYLDDNGEIEVAGYNYLPSQILKNTDPIAYRCGLVDYIDIIRGSYEVEGY